MNSTKARRTFMRSALAVTALTGALVGSTFTAPPAHALFDGDGRHVTGVGAESAGGFWLGAYAPPGNVEQGYPVFCTHMWRANPQPSDTANIATLTESRMWGPDDIDLSTPQMAWLLNKYQANTGATNRAALSYLVHANFEGDDAGKNTQQSVDLLVQKVKEQAGDVHALAAKYTAEARNSAAVGYEKITIEGENKREGVINGIAVTNQNGGYVAGVPMSLTLEGPAVFKETGTNKWEGKSASQPISLTWESTGNGTVTTVQKTSGARKTLTKYGVNGAIQDTLSYGNRPASDPVWANGPSAEWKVIFDFQPIATSNVGESKVVDGNTISDTITAMADPNYGDGKWLEIDGAPIPVTYEGTAYYTGETPADTAGNVPADAKAVGTAVLTFNGPGEQTATIHLPEGTDPGFVTWVWTVTKDKHGENAKYIHTDWSDQYGLSDETSSRRFIAKVDTTIAPRETKSGTYLVDDIWVTGFPENHPDWAGSHNFKADVKNLDQTLLFFPEDVEVIEANKDKAETIASVTVPAKNGFYPTVGSTKFKVKDGNPAGTYVFVTSFAGDDRVKPFATSVEDKAEQFKVEGEMPTLKTTATDKKDGDKVLTPEKNASIVDKVCYTALKPGKEYTLEGVLMDKATNAPLMVDGKQVTASKTFTPAEKNGCETVEFTLDSSSLAGKSTVVFEKALHEGVAVAVHADINDEGQTVSFDGGDEDKSGAGRALAKTGADNAGLIAGALLMSLLGAGALYRRRTHN